MFVSASLHKSLFFPPCSFKCNWSLKTVDFHFFGGFSSWIVESQLTQESEAISSWYISVGLKETKHLHYCPMLENSPGWPTPLADRSQGSGGHSPCRQRALVVPGLTELLPMQGQSTLLWNHLLFSIPCLAYFVSYSNTTLKVRVTDTWVKLPGYKIQPGTNVLIALYLSFPFCKMGILVLPSP